MTYPTGKLSTREWLVADDTERDAVGSDENLQVGDFALNLSTGEVSKCTGVTGASTSTWSVVGSGGITELTPSGGDDTSAVQTAVNSGSIVRLSSGTFSMNSQISATSDVIVQGAGYQTVLDFSAAAGSFPDYGCIVGKGSLTAMPDIAADVAAGDTVIDFASSTGLAAGDVWFIWDDRTFSFNPSRSYYHSGEFFKAIAVDGGTHDVTVDHPAYDSYAVADVANLECHKLTGPRIVIRDCKIIGLTSTNIACVRLLRCRDSLLENLWATGSQYALYAIQQSFNTVVNRCDGEDFGTVGSTNYGVACVNSQRLLVSKCQISVPRHGFTAGGTTLNVTTGIVPSRQFKVSDCILNSKNLAAIDAHGDSEDYQFNDNIANGGIQLGGDKSRVVNNYISNSEDLDITAERRAFIFPEIFGGDHYVVGNVIEEKFTPVNDLVQMAITTPEQITRGGGTIVFHNRIMSYASGSPTVARFQILNSTTNDISLDFDCDVVRNTSDSDPDAYVKILGDSTSHYYWKDIRVRMRSRGCGLFIQDTGAATITVAQGTVITDAQRHGIRIDEASVTYPWTSTYPRQRIHVDAIVERSDLCGIYIEGIGSYPSSLITQAWVNGRSMNNNQGGAVGTDQQSSLYCDNMNLVVTDGFTAGDDQSVATQTRTFAMRDVNTWVRGATVVVGAVSAENETNVDSKVASMSFDTSSAAFGTAAAPIDNIYADAIDAAGNVVVGTDAGGLRYVEIDGATANDTQVRLLNNGTLAWIFGRGATTHEWFLNRRNPTTGANVDDPLTFDSAAGNATFANIIIADQIQASGGTFTVNDVLDVTNDITGDGDLTLSANDAIILVGNASATTPYIAVSGATASNKDYRFYNAGNVSYIFRMEATSHDWFLNRRNATTGANIDQPFRLNYTTGFMEFLNGIQFSDNASPPSPVSANEGIMYIDNRRLYFTDEDDYIHPVNVMSRETFLPGDSEPPSILNPATGTVNNIPVLDFDATSVETTYFRTTIPDDYHGGPIKFEISWAANLAGTGENVVWSIAIDRMLEGDSLSSSTFDTESVVVDAAPGTAHDIAVAVITVAVADLDSAVAGDAIRIRFRRNATSGSDTMNSNDARFVALSMTIV